MGVNGAAKAATVGAIQSGRKGENSAKGAGMKIIDSITSPIPVATIIDKGTDYVDSQLQDNQQEEPKSTESTSGH